MAKDTSCEWCGGTGRVFCYTCCGTGIGIHGDPDTSRCGECGGMGDRVCRCVSDERDEEAYQRWKLRRREKKALKR